LPVRACRGCDPACRRLALCGREELRPGGTPAEPQAPGSPNVPSTLYNGMIACLAPFAVRGAIWYQGESNADRTQQYQTLFPALIRDWRRAWGRDDFAFHFVQLANFTARKPEPAESLWAELREAQTMTLALPHTGMAVAVDIGDAVDIHPPNQAGRRLPPCAQCAAPDIRLPQCDPVRPVVPVGNA